MVDLLLFPVICLLECISKCRIHIMFAFKAVFLFMIWASVVPLWDMVALTFQIIAWIVCTVFHWRTPHLALGKYLVLYSTW